MSYYNSNNDDNNDDFYVNFNSKKNDNVSDNLDSFYDQILNKNEEEKQEETKTQEEIVPTNEIKTEEIKEKKKNKKNTIFKLLYIFIILIVFSTVTVIVLSELKLIKLPWLDYPEVLNLSQNEVMIKRDTSFQFSSKVYPSQVHYGRIIYKSSNPEIAEVNSITGYVEAKSNGMTTITAYLEDYSDIVDTCEVVVSDNNVMVENISVENNNIDLLPNNKYILKYSYSPSNAGLHYFTYSSSDEDILSVTNNGEVTALKSGKAVVEIIDEVSGQSAIQEFTVHDNKNYKIDKNNHVVSNIKVSNSDVTLIAGGEFQVSATVFPKEVPQTITWSSINNNIATVSSDGLITGIDYGKTQIIATAIDGTNKIINVTVQGDEIPVTGINLNDSKLSIALNNHEKISYTIYPKNATNQKIIWSSSDERIASVDAYGNVYGISTGTVTIMAMTDDGEFTSQMVVDVYVPKIAVVETDLILSKTSVTLKAGKTANVDATVLPNNATDKTVNWVSSDSTIASVSGGMIYGKTPGNVTITATTNNSRITKTINVTVTEVPINSISLSDTNYKLGISSVKQLYVTYNPSNANNKNVTWRSTDSSVASVNNSGLVTAHRVGSTEIIAETNNGKVAKCKITVTNERIEVQKITLSKANYLVKTNDTVGVTSIVSPSNATVQSVTLKSDNENVVKVLSDGKVVGVREGVAKITATSNNGKTATSYVVVKNNNPPVYYLDGSSIKYWSDNSFKTYAVTHIWVEDAYKQFKGEMPDKLGSLANANKLMQKAIEKNKGKTMIGINASGFVTQEFSSELYKTNLNWKNTSVSPVVIYEGKVIRDYSKLERIPIKYTIYGMGKDGNLKYYTYDNNGSKNTNLVSTIQNDGVLYTFGWRPLLVWEGAAQDNLAKDVNIRQGICQQDTHNFLYITTITSNRAKGFSPNSLANKMVELGCKTGFNLDGGGSTSLYYVKKGDSKPTKIKVLEGTYGRSIPDILYFYGD